MVWNEWKQLFGKVFLDTTEEQQRHAVFDYNVATIIAHNARHDKGETSFRMGVNQFSAYTHDEFVKVVNLRKMQPQEDAERDIVYLPLPDADKTIDWRKKGAVTPIKNQGMCGSCWAFSTTGATEGTFFLSTGELRILSEQQLIDCTIAEGNHGCGGGTMVNGFKYIQKNHGIDSESDYTYKGIDGVCWTNATKRVVADITGHKTVPPNNEHQLAAAVLHRPVSVGIDADPQAFQNYKSGVFDAKCGTGVDHGVLIVGLTEDAYIVKNSWGPTWGEEGFIRMKRNTQHPYGICGIAMNASYPTRGDSPAPPVPPPTPGPRPEPKSCPGCDINCTKSCESFGAHCCCGNTKTGEFNCAHDRTCCPDKCKSGGKSECSPFL